MVVAPNQMFFGFLIELINTSKGFPVIKIPLVISVTSLYLSVVPRRPRWYQNMLYSHFLQCFLKWAFICFADVFVGKLCSVICLYCSYLKRKYFLQAISKTLQSSRAYALQSRIQYVELQFYTCHTFYSFDGFTKQLAVRQRRYNASP